MSRYLARRPGTVRALLFTAGLAVLFGGPVAVLAVYALAPGWSFPHLVPERFDPRALELALAQWRPMALHLGSSVAYSLCATLLSLLLCLAPAHHLARREFRGRAVVEALLLAPALVPAMTFSMGVHTAFIRIGLADTFVGVVLVLTVFAAPYMLRALVTGYQSFGEDYDLCARNLGAGPLTRLWRVELPLLVPAALAGATVVFLVAFSEYFLVFLIGGGAVPSFTGYLFPALGSSNRGYAAVLTLVFLAVPLVLFVAVEALASAAQRRRGLG
mgnify:CR=1 FL=1